MNYEKNKKKGFSKIDSTIFQTAKQYHLEAALYKYQASKFWNEVAGKFMEEVMEKTRVIDFKKGVLWVACLSREIAAKIKLLADRIIYELNRALGKTVIFAIYTEV